MPFILLIISLLICRQGTNSRSVRTGARTLPRTVSSSMRSTRSMSRVVSLALSSARCTLVSLRRTIHS